MSKNKFIFLFYLTFFILFSHEAISQSKLDFDKLENAVGVVMIYDFENSYIGHGSCFTIDDKGTIITNYHVVENASKIKIRFKVNNSIKDYDVENIAFGNKNYDIVKLKLKLKNDEKTPYLILSETPTRKGDKCWTIGTPADLDNFNTISDGIISNIHMNGIKDWKGQIFQVTAPYSHGSSGGALLNSSGNVIGVTCGGDEGSDGYRANINWAVSINYLNNLKQFNLNSLNNNINELGTISFYTNYKFNGDAFVYVDGIYLGKFNNYFENSIVPNCGDDGTLTKRLSSGLHNYRVYYTSLDQWSYGHVNLNAGDCKLLLIQGPKIQAQGSGFNLSFNIKGLKNEKCYLANYYGDKQYIKDSSIVDEFGNIQFQGNESLPGGIYLFVFPDKTYFEIMIDKDQYCFMRCDKSDAINTMEVYGSGENIDFYSYLQFIQKKSIEMETLKSEKARVAAENKPIDAISAKMKAVDTEVVTFKNNYILEHPGSFLAAIFNASKEPEIPEAPLLPNGARDSLFQFNYYKSHYFDNFDLADERILRTPIYHNKVSNYFKNLVLQIPDSLIPECDMVVAKAKKNKETFKYVVWYLTNTYETSQIMGLDAVFVSMVTKYYTKDQATWVDDATLYKIQDRASILGPILIGKQAKNLILADTAGNYQSMYNINAKFTVLLFWDPDCGHCKKAVPKVKAFYDKAKSKGLEVFAINTAVEEQKWKDYVKENKLNWINVADLKTQNNFRHEFDILTTPQIFILDKNKKILAKKIDEETMEKILCKELGIEFIPHPKDKDDKEEHH